MEAHLVRPAEDLDRVLGRYRGAAPGPLFLALGGIHGNEPSGVLALQRVFAVLEHDNPPFRGEFIGLAGNLGALAANVRFLEKDLNRIWLPDRMAALARNGQPTVPEEREQREILDLVEEAVERAGDAYFLDLHTSSATGLPFACIGDTIRNRRFARAFPVPAILGLEEQVDGALLEFLNNRGLVTLGFEGGQHQQASSVDNHEAAIWIGLETAGCLDPDHLDPSCRVRIRESVARLSEASEELPRFLEIRYRHRIDERDDFNMRPGYLNFQRVEAGELLAHDQNGPIHANYPARILLPLYQAKGSDGFFLARDVRPFWLWVSRMLRYARLDRIVHWLPGVKRHPEVRDALIVNPKLARWFTIQIFHLLGFRKRRSIDGQLVVSRRRYDLKPPVRNEQRIKE